MKDVGIWICHPNGIIYLQTSSLNGNYIQKRKKKKPGVAKSHLSAVELL
jgi:hypothetical protein